MFKYIVFIIFFLTSCSTNKVVTTHGINFIDKKSDKLVINESNRNDIVKVLGPPSTISTFNENIWIYIERKETSTSIFKLGKRKTEKNNVLIVTLDEIGILKKKDFFDLKNMNKIKFSEEITNSGYEKNSYVYDLLTSLREKINSPTKRQTR